MSESFVKIGSLGDFSDGSMKKVHVHDEDVLVANISGNIYAIGDECTHRACSLSEGMIEDTVVTCPCHGGRFDLTTGKVIGPPPERDEPPYEVQLQDSNVLIKKR